MIIFIYDLLVIYTLIGILFGLISSSITMFSAAIYECKCNGLIGDSSFLFLLGFLLVLLAVVMSFPVTDYFFDIGLFK